MTAAVDLVVTPIAVGLVDALAATFAAHDDALGQTRRPVCLRRGTRIELLASLAEDECCTGLVWVRWAGDWPSRNFPTPDQDVRRCDVQRWAVQFEVGAASCAPVGDASTLPTCEEWTASALAEYDDAATIRRALCLYATDHPGTLVQVGAGEPLELDERCGGTTRMVTVAAAACDCVQEGV